MRVLPTALAVSPAGAPGAPGSAMLSTSVRVMPASGDQSSPAPGQEYSNPSPSSYKAASAKA